MAEFLLLLHDATMTITRLGNEWMLPVDRRYGLTYHIMPPQTDRNMKQAILNLSQRRRTLSEEPRWLAAMRMVATVCGPEAP